MPGPIRLEEDEESQHGFMEDSRELLGDGAEAVGRSAKKFWHGFTGFAVQDNVLEVAVGLMYVAIYFHYLVVHVMYGVYCSQS